MKHLIIPAFLLVGAPLLLAEKEQELKSLDKFLFENAIWTTPLADVKAAFDPPKNEEGSEADDKFAAEIRARFKEQGIDIVIPSGNKEGAFEWLSSAHTSLRAPGGNFTLGDKPVGEVNIRSESGEEPTEISISIYNRGDDGILRLSEFETRVAEWKRLLDEKLTVRPSERDSGGAVQIDGWMWRTEGVAWLLEGSISRREKRAEFIRLRLAPLNAHGQTQRTRIARRSSLDANVVKKENGDVSIKGIPMVDQGDKGYCVVASVERVVRYYGAEVDQHELAQLANTDNAGTSVSDMEDAFKRVTGRIHVRTLKHIEFDDRQFERDFKSYNRLAKREGVWYDDRDFDEWWLDPRYLWMKADKKVFREMKIEQAKYDHFNRKVKEFVDQGIPLAWTLYLGMFKEGDMPQSFGGHMRLIIGYNEKTGEIIYTDSWGKGHEYKKMDSGNAWCMTTGLYSMIPNR